MAKRDFVQMCGVLMDVSSSICVYIYLLCNNSHAHGSEAADQHNDGDSMETQRGFNVEERCWEV